MTGIALALSEIPRELFEAHGLKERLHERGGEPEVRFLWRHRPCLLPVWHEGRLIVVRWGCRRGESKSLPLTGWARQETLEAGGWAPFASEPVDIPATFGFDRGIWYGIREGVRGLLVRDEQGEPVVYVL